MRVIDSHTEGEPTRLIIEGGPPLGNGALQARKELFASQYDHFRSHAVNEPRGHDAIVGGLLCEPVDSSCAAGVIYFHNTGFLNMCGHGTIGLAVTLYHLNRIGLGHHKIETPVGVVGIELHTKNEVTIQNVESYLYKDNVSLHVEGLGQITGDIAWGGNWFFLTESVKDPLVLANVQSLSRQAQAICDALESQGIRGKDGQKIDHIELVSKPHLSAANARNFVLCPGGAYDRSPCGTGTSAKMAVMAAKGKLKPNTPWLQESVIGSRFIGSYQALGNGNILPSIRGQAFITADIRLHLDDADPFKYGLKA